MVCLRSTSVLILLAALLTSGCAAVRPLQPQPIPRLSPDAPGGFGHPSTPLNQQAPPLGQRPPFGLYADPPLNATLEALAAGVRSPDGRYQAAWTAQGLWVTRVDAAWLWEVRTTPPLRPTPGTPAPLWTAQSTLLLRDAEGGWHLAEPTAARVEPLAALFKGRDLIGLSPDGLRVRYTLPVRTGIQVWEAQLDGANPRLIEERRPVPIVPPLPPPGPLHGPQ